MVAVSRGEEVVYYEVLSSDINAALLTPGAVEVVCGCELYYTYAHRRYV